MGRVMEKLKIQLERAMAVKAALMLFEWDNETLAPKQAREITARVAGVLSEEYFHFITCDDMKVLVEECGKDTGLSETEKGIVRELKEELDQIKSIPSKEYREFAELVSHSAGVWSEAREKRDFKAFVPSLKKIVEYQKRFASYRARKGQKLYDVMLDTYEKGFDMENLDCFFQELKEELVPLLRKIQTGKKTIDNSFLTRDYPVGKQEELAVFLAEYVGFDFNRGVLGVSIHPFTTNLHNHDVRLTTHYGEKLDSSIFSVIHEAGHGLYELGIRDDLTLTPAGQGASMGMHESQSRFFENIIGRSPAFWEPVFPRLKALFPGQLEDISTAQFVEAVNKVEAGLIRTEADELTYCLHIMIRYEIEKMLVEEDLEVEKLPDVWADKYEEYLGVRPTHHGEGVLQDIHWSQGSFGYFPSYALGSAFGSQLYYHMRKVMDFDELLYNGHIDVICEYLRKHVHQFGKLKTSREILRDVTGEDFNPKYYISYLKEKYGKLYQV